MGRVPPCSRRTYAVRSRKASWLLADAASYSCGTALDSHQLSPVMPWHPGYSGRLDRVLMKLSEASVIGARRRGPGPIGPKHIAVGHRDVAPGWPTGATGRRSSAVSSTVANHATERERAPGWRPGPEGRWVAALSGVAPGTGLRHDRREVALAPRPDWHGHLDGLRSVSPGYPVPVRSRVPCAVPSTRRQHLEPSRYMADKGRVGRSVRRVTSGIPVAAVRRGTQEVSACAPQPDRGQAVTTKPNREWSGREESHRQYRPLCPGCVASAMPGDRAGATPSRAPRPGPGRPASRRQW